MCTLGLVDMIAYLLEPWFYYGLLTLELLDQHWNEIVATPHIRRIMDNFRKRLRQCVDNNGQHLTDVIFKMK